MKRAVLVNGVPAAGKSRIATALARRSGWPLLALDTIKEALFDELGAGDRGYNRKLGLASYRAMFDLVRDWEGPATVIVDAWFGFQPASVLGNHLARAGVGRVVEVWCTTNADVIAARYELRIGKRHRSHPGKEYLQELIALAKRAEPLGGYPLVTVDTSLEPDISDIADRIIRALGESR